MLMVSYILKFKILCPEQNPTLKSVFENNQSVNITGSIACKMNHFIQNASQATKVLDDRIKKGKLDK